MARIVVLGAGIGGMSQVYELRKALGKMHELVLVSDSDRFEFTPSNPWVAVNWRKRKDIEFPVREHLARKGIEFVPVGAKRLHPKENRLELDDGRPLAYDYLVIATGLSEVPKMPRYPNPTPTAGTSTSKKSDSIPAQRAGAARR